MPKWACRSPAALIAINLFSQKIRAFLTVYALESRHFFLRPAGGCVQASRLQWFHPSLVEGACALVGFFKERAAITTESNLAWMAGFNDGSAFNGSRAAPTAARLVKGGT